jgi:HEXXH motif-containing protein
MSRDGGGVRGYAPWRDDPRPAGGPVQGVYAFAGVTGFWQAHRAAARASEQLADFEFALWRRQTARVLEMLRDSQHLTDNGRTFIAGVAATHHATCPTSPPG